MTNRFMISVAAVALIAGTGFANAQGTREGGACFIASRDMGSCEVIDMDHVERRVSGDTRAIDGHCVIGVEIHDISFNIRLMIGVETVRIFEFSSNSA